MTNKLEEFHNQIIQLKREITEMQEQLEYTVHRFEEEKQKEQKTNVNVTLTLNSEQLHKLLCYIEHTIVVTEAVEDDKARRDLIDYAHDLSWDIAELLEVDLNEGNIDPKTFQFYTYKSRR